MVCILRFIPLRKQHDVHFGRSVISNNQEVDFTEKKQYMSPRSTFSFVLQGPLR